MPNYNLFNKKTLFHIPHSSTFIPDYSDMIKNVISDEINYLTDFNTDQIFNVHDSKKLIFPYSRIYCDVERLPNEIEPMQLKGQGIYYTHNSNEKPIRAFNPKIWEHVMNIYNEHHLKLKNMTQSIIDTYDTCTIIDSHSFPSNTNDPQICIGTDDFHTPKSLTNKIIDWCETYNLSYKINDPYKGTIVPLDYYLINPNVHSIMIEINKNLYMENNVVNYDKIRNLNHLINMLFN